MNKLEQYQRELRHLDELARLSTPVHALHPLAKVTATVAFFFVVVSFPEQYLLSLALLLAYPVFLSTAGNIPWDFLLLRLALVSPFILSLAASSALFEYFIHKDPSAGAMLFTSILLKLSLAVLAALLLLATTGIPKLAAALYLLPIPQIFVNQLLFLYRYLNVLAEEVLQAVEAYSLRSVEKDVARKVWGSFAGQILSRASNRTESIQHAMLLRGFSGRLHFLDLQKADFWDVTYVFLTISTFLTIRLTAV